MTKKYQVIYADPPWRYDFCKDNADRIENHYSTMALEDIKVLSIPSADNAVLYLWATAPKLLEALAVMKAWGFTYKTQCIWDKLWIGMGYWFRGQHEILLVGTKGKISPPSSGNRVSSIYREKRTKHSKKPDYFRDIISKCFPIENKIELFAREPHDGWDVWGNEVNSDIELTLPVISHTEMFRAGERFVGDKSQANPVQATTTSPNENPPRNDEHRQRIINAASAELRKRRNQK